MPETLDRKIKIAFVTAALEVGGAEKFLFDLLKHLDKNRFEPLLVTVVGGGSLEEQFRALGIPVHIFGRQRIRYLGGLYQFWQLYNLFKKEKPDIVHTQLFAPDFWGRLAAWLAGVPIITTTEQNVNFDQSAVREWLKKLTYRLTKGVVAISSAVKKYLQEQYAVPEEKIVIIPNDVDLVELEKRLQAARSANTITKPVGKKIIFTTGRLVEQKGQKHLLEAFTLLPNRRDLELWLAGDGRLRPDLEQHAVELGIAEQVKFLGTRNDVSALLAVADIFVFPSLWEGLGIAVLEAAAAKVPIVASAVDGVLDILADQQTGLLVLPGDSKCLAKAIEWVLEHPGESTSRAEKAYQFVKDNFDVKVVVKKYEEWWFSFFSLCHSRESGNPAIMSNSVATGFPIRSGNDR